MDEDSTNQNQVRWASILVKLDGKALHTLLLVVIES